MARALIVFGNGLGMAVDHEYFQLREGLASAWDSTDTFTEDHKRMIASAIPGVDNEHYPEHEDQLDTLQMALVASNFLKSLERDDVQWLSDGSRELPVAVRRFVHAVAVYFHASNQSLPLNFADALGTFVKETKSHVAVLNYDNLLYDALYVQGVLQGFNGALIDGFLKNGFASENLDRFYPGRLGWYLHLHGSPLFVGNKKVMRDARDFLDPTHESHIVLTHVTHKPSIINSSPILSEYWNRLNRALDEAACVILFGYSGEDLHLNEKIVTAASSKTIHIIEWAGAGEQQARTTYWHQKLQGHKVNLIRLENILDFRNWSTLT